MRRALRFVIPIVCGVVALSGGPLGADVDPATLPVVSYHPGGPSYWDRPYFANALLAGGAWTVDWSGVPHWNVPQFDDNGFPLYLESGQRLIAPINGLHAGYGDEAPPGWPDLLTLLRGHFVLTWQGTADIRVEGGPGTFLGAESSGPETGLLTDGRRVYRFSEPPGWISIYAISGGVTDIRVWLPDPEEPDTLSLEGQLFHPTFLDRLADAPWGLIRFMDWGRTNASPVQDWSDRRPPSHAFAVGVLNPRPPADGFAGDRSTGVAYEHMVALANAADKDLWINVPHLATDDFVTRLAQLIRYGSDGTNPYTAPVASPVWPPLEEGLMVYVEYSNEIWSGGNSFAQGEWANDRAQELGISKAAFNGRRFCQVWRVFQGVFGGSARLVRVAAVFTAHQSYTTEFLEEIRDYGPTLSPAVEPDVVAMTTYFGNGIQDWAHETARQRAGTSDPWFYTTETFDAGGGDMRPVSLPTSDPYWASDAYARHRREAFGEWRRRILAGSAAAGGGPDATGLGGGFDVWLADLARTTFSQPKPLVAYEGGPSLYTDYMNGGDVRDDGITWFISAMNRDPEIRELYDIHLNMAWSKGLWTHSAFVDCSVWGKYGQWGHLEHLDQPLAEAPKYAFLLDHIAEMSGLRHVDDPRGAVPVFETGPTLPGGLYQSPYSVDLRATGGDGSLSARVIGASLVPGLVAEPVAGEPGTVRLHGTPLEAGPSYVYVRATDGDGDPAWRIFTAYVGGGPGALLDSDFRGADPALHTPWTPYYFLSPTVSAYSGWQLGPGVQGHAGDDRLVFSVNAPATPATLAEAIADGEFLSASLESSSPLGLRRGRVRFTIDRLDYHAPRSYAVFTGVGGFAEGQEVFVTPHFTDQNAPRDFAFDLPDLAAYDTTTTIEIRLYGFAGQYGGHRSSLTAFAIGNELAALPRLVVGDASVVEGDSGTMGLEFTITLDQPAAEPVTVDWTTADTP
ncbi:MAG: hypothetical protein LJF30_26260 [Acidobacteria bacterium]|nr:hypothetical protein [Acidobacteriota bacterium]